MCREAIYTNARLSVKKSNVEKWPIFECARLWWGCHDDDKVYTKERVIMNSCSATVILKFSQWKCSLLGLRERKDENIFCKKKKKVVTVVWRLKLSVISGDKQIIMTPTQSTLNVFRSLPVLIYPTPMPFPEISVLIRPYVKVENNDNNPFLSRFLSTSSGRKRNRKLKLI